MEKAEILKINIESDGTPFGTKITDAATGRVILCRCIEFKHDAADKDYPTVILTVHGEGINKFSITGVPAQVSVVAYEDDPS